MLVVDLGSCKERCGKAGKGVVNPVAISTHLEDRTLRYQVDIRKAPWSHNEVEKHHSRQWVTKDKAPSGAKAVGLSSWVVGLRA